MSDAEFDRLVEAIDTYVAHCAGGVTIDAEASSTADNPCTDLLI